MTWDTGRGQSFPMDLGSCQAAPAGERWHQRPRGPRGLGAGWASRCQPSALRTDTQSWGVWASRGCKPGPRGGEKLTLEHLPFPPALWGRDIDGKAPSMKTPTRRKERALLPASARAAPHRSARAVGTAHADCPLCPQHGHFVPPGHGSDAVLTPPASSAEHQGRAGATTWGPCKSLGRSRGDPTRCPRPSVSPRCPPKPHLRQEHRPPRPAPGTSPLLLGSALLQTSPCAPAAGTNAATERGEKPCSRPCSRRPWPSPAAAGLRPAAGAGRASRWLLHPCAGPGARTEPPATMSAGRGKAQRAGQGEGARGERPNPAGTLPCGCR